MLAHDQMKTPNPVQDELDGIIVRLQAGEDQCLFIMLGADGSINRLGTGDVDNTEQDLFIGRTDPALFRDLVQSITPELLNWCGQSLADPEPQGKECELTVGFRWLGGKEAFTCWRYGTESDGPPPEIQEFVGAAMRGTDPWFSKQKAMARGHEG